MNDQTRRGFLKSMGLLTGTALAAPFVVRRSFSDTLSSIQNLRKNIDHIVIIFQENRAFDHYFGTFIPRDGQIINNLIDRNTGKINEKYSGYQKDVYGVPFATLPLPLTVPEFLDVQLPNKPFHLAPYIPANSRSNWGPDHAFFRMMAQINNGKMDHFVAFANGPGRTIKRNEMANMPIDRLDMELSKPSGVVLGYYDGKDIPYYHKLAHEYVLFDRFYQAMSGGSTGNALYLAQCRSCINNSIPQKYTAPYNQKIIATYHAFFGLPYNHEKILISDISPVQGPTSGNNVESLLMLSPPPEDQHYDNIGDRLNAAGLDWAWYNENWNLVKPWALKTAYGQNDGSAVLDTEMVYVAHHNPFQYSPRWFDYVRQGHIRDATDFIQDARDGKLPSVSFLKASGAHDEHPKQCAPAFGIEWVKPLVDAVASSPSWKNTAIFITYDEGGGLWDSKAPVVVDDYGFGTRIPALLISPWAKKGFIDHNIASTASILSLIETRFGLKPLNHRDGSAYDLMDAFDWHQKISEFKL